MRLYKVLRHVGDRLLSAHVGFEYKPHKGYYCKRFDSNPDKWCSGYYATDIEGLLYSFCNLPGYEVWEVEVEGKRVYFNPFHRKYAYIELIDRVPVEKVRELALAEEERVGYKLAEALFPVNPFEIEAGPVTEKELGLLRDWALVADLVKDSVGDSLGDSAWSLARDMVWNSVGNSVQLLLFPDRSSAERPAMNPVGNAIWGYISSLFPGIERWEYIDHPEGINPFQACVDLWRSGFVPAREDGVWRLYTGKGIVWKADEQCNHVRKIDELGRVVIPKEIRRILGIREGDTLLLSIQDGAAIVRKMGK